MNNVGNIPQDQGDSGQGGVNLADRVGNTYGTPAERSGLMARMTSNSQPAPHELICLHELILRNTAATQKLEAVVGAVTDPKLRILINRSIEDKRARLQKVRGFLEHHRVIQ